MLLGSAGTWPQHGGTGRKAWHFPTQGQPIGQTGRKDRKRHWKIKGGPEMKKLALWCLWIEIGFFVYPFYADACSCAWKGPFLTVSKDAPLVIHGRIIRHHPGKSPSMDVLVLETLKGAILDSGMVVQMGDGMHCRPTLEGSYGDGH